MKLPDQGRVSALLNARIRKLEALSDRLSWGRLVAFLAALAIGTWAALEKEPGSFVFFAYFVSGLALAAFALLALWQSRVERSQQLTRARIEVSRRRAAVRELAWDQLPPERPLPAPGARPWPEYFADLDIAGSRSLLRLMDWTGSTGGRERLCELFRSNEVTDAEVLRRATLVRELRALPLVRARYLSRMGLSSEVIDFFRMGSLLGQVLCHEGAVAAFAGLLSLQAALLVSFTVFFFGGGKPYFLIPALLLFFGHSLARKRIRTREAYEYSIAVSLSLGRFRSATETLEKHSGTARPTLRSVLAPFAGEAAASSRLRSLDRVTGALGVRQNPVAFLLVQLLFPWEAFWTLRLERLRAKIASQLPAWQAAVAEFEAFLSVAEYAEANREFAEAELSRAGFLNGRNVRHPLIARDLAVGNDVSLNESERCILITGSNMSGKSTFLRAVGINVLLAKAGAPVAADRFRFPNAPVFTSLRVGDSLLDGLSSFSAELRRLREILTEARAPQRILYLIDEIFRGTNNRERLIGSRAYLREITRTASFGLVTTHDLELVTLEKANPGIVNFHFKETIANGTMSFTFRKEKGPCPTTNALELMRLNGLPVEGGESS